MRSYPVPPSLFVGGLGSQLFCNYPVPPSHFVGELAFDNLMRRYPVPPALFVVCLGVGGSFAIIPCPRPFLFGGSRRLFCNYPVPRPTLLELAFDTPMRKYPTFVDGLGAAGPLCWRVGVAGSFAIIPCPRPILLESWHSTARCADIPCPRPSLLGRLASPALSQLSRAPVPFCWGGLGFDNPMCRYPVPPSLFVGGLGVAGSFAIIPCPRPVFV